MLELPEVLTIASQLTISTKGKVVKSVSPPSKEHKFCWYNGDVREYDKNLSHLQVLSAEGFGIFVEILFESGFKLCFNDGVNVRLVKEEDAPKSYQLKISFMDGDVLVFTVSMYGSIILHSGEYNNEYYLRSKGAMIPFSEEFKAYYFDLLKKSKDTLSLKAFLATEQRFPGIGNGVLQDILFHARLHPKRKLKSLQTEEQELLYSSILKTLLDMKEKGGRDTEKDLYQNPGAYQTVMSKNTVHKGCAVCGGAITKETFLGGSVYYCGHCQPL